MYKSKKRQLCKKIMAILLLCKDEENSGIIKLAKNSRRRKKYKIPAGTYISLNTRQVAEFFSDYTKNSIGKSSIENYIHELEDVGCLFDAQLYKFKDSQKFFSKIYKYDKQKLKDFLLIECDFDFDDNWKEAYDIYKAFMLRIRKNYETIKKALENPIHNMYGVDLLEKINDNYLPRARANYLKQGRGRLCNVVNTTPNPDHTDDINKKETRQKALSEYYYMDEYEEMDVNASIYRLTYNLFNDLPFDMDKDVYEEFYLKMCELLGVEPEDALGREERNHIKLVAMPIYMKESSITYSVWQYERLKEHIISQNENGEFSMYEYLETVIKNGNNIMDNTGKKCNSENLKKYRAWAYFEEKYGEKLQGIIENKGQNNMPIIKMFLYLFADAMKLALFGKVEESGEKVRFMGYKIFFYESDLHLMMLNAFSKYDELTKEIAGKKYLLVANSYDGFYINTAAKSGDRIDVESIFNEAYSYCTKILCEEFKNLKPAEYYLANPKLTKKNKKKIEDDFEEDFEDETMEQFFGLETAS